MPRSKKMRVDDANDSRHTAEVAPVSLLQSKLVDRPGYSKFRDSCHKVLQNPDIPSHWEFAAKFSADFRGRSITSVSFSHQHLFLPHDPSSLSELTCHKSDDSGSTCYRRDLVGGG